MSENLSNEPVFLFNVIQYHNARSSEIINLGVVVFLPSGGVDIFDSLKLNDKLKVFSPELIYDDVASVMRNIRSIYSSLFDEKLSVVENQQKLLQWFSNGPFQLEKHGGKFILADRPYETVVKDILHRWVN